MKASKFQATEPDTTPTQWTRSSLWFHHMSFSFLDAKAIKRKYWYKIIEHELNHCLFQHCPFCMLHVFYCMRFMWVLSLFIANIPYMMNVTNFSTHHCFWSSSLLKLDVPLLSLPVLYTSDMIGCQVRNCGTSFTHVDFVHGVIQSSVFYQIFH